MSDRDLAGVLQQALGMGPEQEEALWADFTRRAAEEAATWVAFAGALVLASRQLRAVTPNAVWPGWFLR